MRVLSHACVVTLALSGLCGLSCSSDDEGGGDGGKAGGDASTGGAGGSGGDGGTGGQAGAAGGGTAGQGGGAAGSGGAAGEAGVLPYEPLLSQTGLYSDIVNRTLNQDIIEYQPQFVLWSDSASKNRWLYLPPGTQIDTSNMDYWVYPVGTRAWKEFTRDGVLVETRLLHKYGANQWAMVAYQWNSAGTEAMPVPAGVQNASSTQHDIPSSADCTTCHDKMEDKLLSVSAIQLSHTLPGKNLMDLAQVGKLTNPPSAPFTLPGNATDRAAPVNHGVPRRSTHRLQQIVQHRVVERTRQHRHRLDPDGMHERVDLPVAEVSGEQQHATPLSVRVDDALFPLELDVLQHLFRRHGAELQQHHQQPAEMREHAARDGPALGHGPRRERRFQVAPTARPGIEDAGDAGQHPAVEAAGRGRAEAVREDPLGGAREH